MSRLWYAIRLVNDTKLSVRGAELVCAINELATVTEVEDIEEEINVTLNVCSRAIFIFTSPNADRHLQVVCLL